MRKSRVVAILCSDLHISHNPPIARSAEPDWYRAMTRPFKEMKKLAESHQCPIVCAGDVFHKWNSPPELINWAIQTLPKMYAVPGQHDLPHHNLEDIKKSAYWTLVEAGKIVNLEPNDDGCLVYWNLGSKLTLHGFAWGVPVRPLTRPKNTEDLHLAVIHAYCWKGENHPGATPEQEWTQHHKNLEGYDAAVFGDNHKGFIANNGRLMNCGAFMRRNSDEIEYDPRIGLLMDDGLINSWHLSTKKDRFLDLANLTTTLQETLQVDVTGLVGELMALEHAGFDFVQALRAMLVTDNVPVEVGKVISQAIEKVQ